MSRSTERLSHSGDPTERMNLMLATGKSNCCGAALTLGGTPDFPGQHYAATVYYVCTKCGEACDPMPTDAEYDRSDGHA